MHTIEPAILQNLLLLDRLFHETCKKEFNQAQDLVDEIDLPEQEGWDLIELMLDMVFAWEDETGFYLLPDMFRLFIERPKIYMEFLEMEKERKRGMDTRSYQLIENGARRYLDPFKEYDYLTNTRKAQRSKTATV
jgi:hypothetical protein